MRKQTTTEKTRAASGRLETFPSLHAQKKKSDAPCYRITRAFALQITPARFTLLSAAAHIRQPRVHIMLYIFIIYAPSGFMRVLRFFLCAIFSFSRFSSRCTGFAHGLRLFSSRWKRTRGRERECNDTKWRMRDRDRGGLYWDRQFWGQKQASGVELGMWEPFVEDWVMCPFAGMGVETKWNATWELWSVKEFS